jgi:hypothetical protein
MVEVEFSSGGEKILTVRASQGHSPQFEGDSSWFDENFTPYSERLACPIHWQEDAEEWARSLPQAYAETPTQAQVTRDDSPPDHPVQAPAAAPPNVEEDVEDDETEASQPSRSRIPDSVKTTATILAIVAALAAAVIFAGDYFLEYPGPDAGELIKKTDKALNSDKANYFSYQGTMTGDVSLKNIGGALGGNALEAKIDGQVADNDFSINTAIKDKLSEFNGKLIYSGGGLFLSSGKTWYGIGPEILGGQAQSSAQASNINLANYFQWDEVETYEGPEIDGVETWKIDINFSELDPPADADRAQWNKISEGVNLTLYTGQKDNLPRQVVLTLKGSTEEWETETASQYVGEFDLVAEINFTNWGQKTNVSPPANAKNLLQELQENPPEGFSLPTP